MKGLDLERSSDALHILGFGKTKAQQGLIQRITNETNKKSYEKFKQTKFKAYAHSDGIQLISDTQWNHYNGIFRFNQSFRSSCFT
jgi:hypothetical protein